MLNWNHRVLPILITPDKKQVVMMILIHLVVMAIVHLLAVVVMMIAVVSPEFEKLHFQKLTKV